MTKLTETQETKLIVFERAYKTLRETEEVIDAQLAEEKARRLSDLRVNASRLGNAAVASGVPVARLGDPTREGMKTRNWGTIKNFLNLTADLPSADADDYREHVERFALVSDENGTLLRITMAGEEWEEFMAENKDRMRGNAAALNSGDYPILPDGTLLDATGPEDRTTPNKWDNPVTGWLRYHDGMAEAEAWLASRYETTEAAA